MVRKIGMISKSQLKQEGYFCINKLFSTAALSDEMDYIESDGGFIAKAVNNVFRTNQSYSKTLVVKDKLYSYQYYALGRFNVYEFDLLELKEIRQNGAHGLVLEENSGECIELETIEASASVVNKVTELAKASKKRGPKLSHRSLN